MNLQRPKAVFKVAYGDRADYFFDINSAFSRGIEVMKLHSPGDTPLDVNIITIKMEEVKYDSDDKREN